MLSLITLAHLIIVTVWLQYDTQGVKVYVGSVLKWVG